MTKVMIHLFLLCLLLLSPVLSPVCAEEKHLRILHVNDFHGYAEPRWSSGSGEEVGGAAFLAAKIKELGSEKPSLLIAAGDMIQGDAWANLSSGESVISLMNALRFDAMVVGNHEFDFGQETLKARIAEARFPFLGANVRGLENLRPYITKDIDGIRIAVIGVVTEETPLTTHPRNVRNLQFDDPVQTVEKYVAALRPDNDVVIVLSHLGHPADRHIAEKVNGIDLITGGHSHTRVDAPPLLNNTLVLQAWEHGKTLGVVDLVLDNGRIVSLKGYLVDIKPALIREDPLIAALVADYKRKVDGVLGEEIGLARLDLNAENVRTKETNLGNFIADVIRFTAGADAVILNGGDIRSGIRKGPVQIKHIYSALPFNDYIIAVKLTGRQIREALEHGVSAVGEEAGRFPQISGITFSYAPSAAAGSRIRGVMIAGHPLDPSKYYIVATNDFLTAGGDGYTVFSEAIGKSRENIVFNDSSRFLKDIVVEYIRKKKELSFEVEGRITEVD